MIMVEDGAGGERLRRLLPVMMVLQRGVIDINIRTNATHSLVGKAGTAGRNLHTARGHWQGATNARQAGQDVESRRRRSKLRAVLAESGGTKRGFEALAQSPDRNQWRRERHKA